MRRMVAVLIIVPFALSAMTDSTHGANLYWLDSAAGKIGRAPSDGSGPVETLVSGIVNGRQIAVDPLGESIYWTDISTGEIRHSGINGELPSSLITGLSSPYGIAVDPVHGKIYWSEIGAETVKIANLGDGSGATTIASNVTGVQGMAIDVGDDSVFWGQGAVGATAVNRASLDGNNQSQFLSGLATPHDMSIDVIANKIYWSDGGNTDFYRSNYDGTSHELVATPFGEASGIGVDVTSGEVFYSDLSNTNIFINTTDDLGDIGTIHYPGIAATSIVIVQDLLVPEPSTFTLCALGLLLLGQIRRRRRTSLN